MELSRVCDTLWRNTVQRKMYITGAFGATHIGEAFMSDYELPGDSAYAETCAAIAMLFFSRAMLRVRRDGEISDVMERILYNGMLSGMSLEADRFFYVNPLETVSGLSGEQPGYTHALPQRPRWFGCACCPPNHARLIASLPDYTYDEDQGDIAIHQYIGGKIHTDAFGGVTIEHESLYPWDGALRWTVKANERFTLSIRVPGWAGEGVIRISHCKNHAFSTMTIFALSDSSQALQVGYRIILCCPVSPVFPTCARQLHP